MVCNLPRLSRNWESSQCMRVASGDRTHLPFLLGCDLGHRCPGHPSLGESSCPLTIATRRTLRGVAGAPGHMLTAGHVSAVTHQSLSPGGPPWGPEKFFRKNHLRILQLGYDATSTCPPPAGAQPHPSLCPTPPRPSMQPSCGPCPWC